MSAAAEPGLSPRPYRPARRSAPAMAAAGMAKRFDPDAEVARIADAVRDHGGSGAMRGVTLERLDRDANFTQIHDGTNQIQRMTMARKLPR